MTLILASASPIRRQMLDAAGVAVRAVAADIDEAAIKAACDGAVAAATALAEAKASRISANNNGEWVIGSDSIVSVNGRMFDKPRDRGEAADHLRMFSGQRMTLTSAAAIARDGSIEWSVADQAQLRVRELSDHFIANYLDAEWPDVAYCVGVFRMEGRGVQLFDSIDGSYFTILGMPLLPLLAALRERGLVPA